MRSKHERYTYTDRFSSLGKCVVASGVQLCREYPRIVTRPDVRINTDDPGYYVYDGPKAAYAGRVCGHGWFPFILRLASGDLLCIYTESSAHVYCPGGRTVASRSSDGGRTWSEAQVLYYKQDWINHPGYGHVQTTDGRILVSIRSQYFDETDVFDPRSWTYQDTILVSEDDGHTWGTLIASPEYSGVGEGRRSIPRPAIEMSNGRVLWLGAATDERGDPIRATFLHSEQDGEICFERRDHPELGPTSDEWYVVETRIGGELVAMMRNQQHSQYFATAKSYDYGRTWTPWRESNVYMGGFPTRPMLCRTDDGVLLFSYGQRWIGRTFVVASFDDGETWDVAHRQSILHSPKEYHKIWDSHYTDLARAEGRKWLAVDYIASPRKEEQKGIYGTYLDERYFRDVFSGLSLRLRGTPVGKDTVGHWSFDELEGEFARDAVNDNYGAIHRAERTTGKIGGALQFDGRRSYCMVYDDATLRVPKYFTLEAWVYVEDPQRDQTILSKAPRYTLCLREGKLALEIGENVALSEGATIAARQWTHVAVTFGMRQMYSRATFYVNGEEDSWVQPVGSKGSAVRPASFSEAMELSDAQIVGGERYQEFGHKNHNRDNLVIGMDNNLRTRAFAGRIDEVAIHRGDRSAERIRESVERRYHPAGCVTSPVIQLPRMARWTRFLGQKVEPPGTRLVFSILDEQGRVLRTVTGEEEDLAGQLPVRLVLRADLITEDPGQTPLLLSWTLGCSGRELPKPVTSPLPEQRAALARSSSAADSGVAL